MQVPVSGATMAPWTPGRGDRRGRLTVTSVLVALAFSLPTAPGGAVPDESRWSIHGSVQASLEAGCGSSPTCLAFLAAGRLGGGCARDAVVQDGVELSIVELPEGAAGALALFRWSSAAELLSSMTVGWIGEINGVCRDLGYVSLAPSADAALFGYGTGTVTVEPQARFVYVGAERAVDIRWYLDERTLG